MTKLPRSTATPHIHELLVQSGERASLQRAVQATLRLSFLAHKSKRARAAAVRAARAAQPSEVQHGA